MDEAMRRRQPPTNAGNEQSGNERAAREAFRIWHESRGRDASPFIELMADEVDFWSVANGGASKAVGFTGVRSKKSEIVDYFSHVNRSLRMDFYNVEAMVASGDEVIVIIDAQFLARVSGKTIRTLVFIYLQFRDGKIVRCREMFDSAAALAAMKIG